jgi:membrane dipeptidase
MKTTIKPEPQIAPGPAMPRRRFLNQCAGAGLAAGSLSAFAADVAGTAGNTPKRMLIIDTLGEFTDPNLPESDTKGPDLGVDARALADVKASGLSAVNLTIGYVFGKEEPFEKSVSDIGLWDALIRRRPDALAKVLTANDIRQAHAHGKLGVIYGFQNAIMMGSDAKRAALFANLGVRVIQLTYNVRNQLGDGSMVPENKGLTEFGREVVHELNRNRVLVDLSHSGENICLDAVAVSDGPIIISHTGCRALADLPRNKTDKELRLVAEKGGYVGMYFMPFLAIGRQPMADDLIAHIDHAVQVCGEDHVGIGTDGTVPDIDNMPQFLETFRKEVEMRRKTGIGASGERGDIVKFLPDLNGPQKFHKLADLLSRRGYSEARIEKIMGGNFLRVAEHVWQA